MTGGVIYTLRPHPALWLPVRRPAERELVRAWGDTEIRLRTDSDCGLPHGEDRLVLMLLVTAAVRQQSRELRLPTTYQILQMFGLAPSGRNYGRLAERLRRVTAVEFSVTTGSLTNVGRICEEHDGKRALLTESFWEFLGGNTIPLELAVVRKLADSPSTLDFYTWLAARAYSVRPDRYASVPLFGRQGLGRLLGVAGYTQPRDFRRRVKRWLAELRECWFDCPAVLSRDEQNLLVCRVQPAGTPPARLFVMDEPTRARVLAFAGAGEKF